MKKQGQVQYDLEVEGARVECLTHDGDEYRIISFMQDKDEHVRLRFDSPQKLDDFIYGLATICADWFCLTKPTPRSGLDTNVKP